MPKPASRENIYMGANSFFFRSAPITGRAHKKGVMDIEPSRILQKAVAPYHSYLALVTLKYNIICINLIVSKDFKSL